MTISTLSPLPEFWKDLPLAVFDLETTSTDIPTAKITEVGIIHFDNGEVTKQYDQLVNPMQPIPAEAARISHITDEMVKNEPVFSEIIPDILPLFENRAIVAFNIGFDVPILERHLKEAGHDIHLPSTRIDPLIIARQFIKGGSRKLESLCKRYQISHDNAHRADCDAIATGRLLFRLAEEFPDIPKHTNELLGKLAAWEKEQDSSPSSMYRRNNRKSPTSSLSSSPFTGLGNAFIYGTESDPLRALYSTAPIASQRDTSS